VQLAGFTGITFSRWNVTQPTVTIDPPRRIVDEAIEQYELEQPTGDRCEKIAEYVLDRVRLEVAVNAE
jgi:hypothetical protein